MMNITDTWGLCILYLILLGFSSGFIPDVELY